MGVLRFRVNESHRVPSFVTEVAHVCGMDRIPWRGTTEWDGSLLIHRRPIDESGVFFGPWILNTGRWTTLVTSSLREQAAEYQLEREFARGTISRLRELHAQMVSAGCPISETAEGYCRQSQDTFLSHVGVDTEASCQAIDQGVLAIEALMKDLLSFRKQKLSDSTQLSQSLRLGTVGTPFPSIESEEAFVDLFDTVSIPVRWREIETENGKYDWQSLDRWVTWAAENGRRISMGPLLRLDAYYLPEWIYLLQNRTEVLRKSVFEFIQEIVKRYRDHVDLWQCTSGLNLPGESGLDSDERVQLAVIAVKAVSEISSNKPIVMRFDQPWGEHLIANELEFSAFQFADSLIGAKIGLSGLGIDFHFGYWPGGSLNRDSLQFHLMLQRWSMFELPLLIGFAVPHSSLDSNDNYSDSLLRTDQYLPTPLTQAAELERLLSVAVTAPYVHGIAYSAFFDHDSLATPLAGLIDDSGFPRPACQKWYQVMSDR